MKNKAAKERKRRLGDRYDGRHIKSIDPLTRLMPYIMKTKNSSNNIFRGTLDILTTERYIRKKRAEGFRGLGMLHIFTAAFVRIVSQRPAINRFISGRRYYARNEISINMTIKKEMTLNAEETTIKVYFEPLDTINEVYKKINDAIEEARAEAGMNNTDFAVRVFNALPGPVLRFAVWLIDSLDRVNLMPKWINKVSPFHGSLFISNLGSIGLEPVAHHLYDFGNISLFLCFGNKYTKYDINPQGNTIQRRLIDYSLVMDERICDGYYFSSAFRMLKDIIKKPDILDNPPEKVNEDIK